MMLLARAGRLRNGWGRNNSNQAVAGLKGLLSPALSSKGGEGEENGLWFGKRSNGILVHTAERLPDGR